jgi:AAA+ superfamily predicted ATPase
VERLTDTVLVKSIAARRRKFIGRKLHSGGSDSDSSSSSSNSSSSSSRRGRSKKDRKRSVVGSGAVLPVPINQPAQKREKADIDPMAIDTSVTWESIGGLQSHIRSLKEMVLFPLLYPELYSRLGITPPRGVLFYGPPGTGKTLVARALANTCSQDGQRVSFFMRKGADILSKWVGEAERQLRLLFDQAYKMQPSIIFFDEIDGLAPVRSSRQDQIHNSIVSTLLALLDGLDNRGNIVVIGATNRIDTIDPALRRPGRFDREFAFSLPSKEARREILKIHTRDWRPALPAEVVDDISARCVGYCGADIKALVTEAALRTIRRKFPQIYESNKRLLVSANAIRPTAADFITAMQSITPASQRSTPTCVFILLYLHLFLSLSLSVALIDTPSCSHASPLPPHLHPLIGDQLAECVGVLQAEFPPLQQGAAASVANAELAAVAPVVYRPRLLLAGADAHAGQSLVSAALLHLLEGAFSPSLSPRTFLSSCNYACRVSRLLARSRHAARRSFEQIDRRGAGSFFHGGETQAALCVVSASHRPLVQLVQRFDALRFSKSSHRHCALSAAAAARHERRALRPLAGRAAGAVLEQLRDAQSSSRCSRAVLPTTWRRNHAASAPGASGG